MCEFNSFRLTDSVLTRNTSGKSIGKSTVHILTCNALDDDDELNSISFVQSPPALLVVVSMAEVPTRSVQQSEVVPTRWKIKIFLPK